LGKIGSFPEDRVSAKIKISEEKVAVKSWIIGCSARILFLVEPLIFKKEIDKLSVKVLGNRGTVSSGKRLVVKGRVWRMDCRCIKERGVVGGLVKKRWWVHNLHILVRSEDGNDWERLMIAE